MSCQDNQAVTEKNLTTAKNSNQKEYSLKCDSCQITFADKEFLLSHIQKFHILKKKSPIKCDICDRDFKFPSDLKYHYRIHTGERPYKCEVCDKNFMQKDHLKKHELCHSKHSRALPGEVKDKGQWDCKYCGKSCQGYRDLLLHMRKHGRKKPLECGFCEKSFFNLKSRYEHEAKVHVDKQTFKCSVCSIMFKEHGRLLRHQNQVHPLSSSGPLVCSYCGKGYIRHNQYLLHMEQHKKMSQKMISYVKVYQCFICKEMIQEENKLISHLATHNLARFSASNFSCNYVKAFTCEICNATVLEKEENLMEHMKTHHANGQDNFTDDMVNGDFDIFEQNINAEETMADTQSSSCTTSTSQLPKLSLLDVLKDLEKHNY